MTAFRLEQGGVCCDKFPGIDQFAPPTFPTPAILKGHVSVCQRNVPLGRLIGDGRAVKTHDLYRFDDRIAGNYLT